MALDRRARQFIIRELIVRAWWVWVCAVFAFGLRERAVKSISEEMVILSHRAQQLSFEIAEKEASQKILALQLASRDDPAWIELTLIRHLGLVPEGYTKIYLQDEEGAP